MPANYTCQSCGVHLSLDAAVPSMPCPKCKREMQLESGETVRPTVPRTLRVARPAQPAAQGPGAAALKTASAVTPGAPVESGLRVAAAQQAVNPNLPGETAHAGSFYPGGAGFAQEMERMVETARRQAEKEMELTLEAARLKAEKESRQILSQAEKEAAELKQNAQLELQQELAELRKAEQAKLDEQLAETKKNIAGRLEQEIQKKRDEGEKLLAKELEAKREEAQKILIEKARQAAEETRAKVKEMLAEAEQKAQQLQEQAEKNLAEAKQKSDEQSAELEKKRLEFDERLRSESESAKAKLQAEREELEKKEKALTERRDEIKKLISEAEAGGLKVLTLSDEKELEQLRAQLSEQEQRLTQEADKRLREAQTAFERRLLEQRKSEIDAGAGKKKLQLIEIHAVVLLWFYALLMGLRCEGWRSNLSWAALFLISVALIVLFYRLRQALALFVKKTPAPAPAATARESKNSASITAQNKTGSISLRADSDGDKKLSLAGADKKKTTPSAFPTLKKPASKTKANDSNKNSKGEQGSNKAGQ